MKKLIVTLAFGIIATASGLAQGTIFAVNGASPLNITTNGTPVGQGTGSTAGAGAYYYGIFVSPTVQTSTNVLAGTPWTFSNAYLTNLASGGAISGGTAEVVTGWAANATSYFMLAGWSANLGTTWTSVLYNIGNNYSGVVGTPYFGVSSVGFGVPGGGVPAQPVFHIFGVGAGQIQGFTLTAAAVPEPGTLALAALGGASLLLFRRRK